MREFFMLPRWQAAISDGMDKRLPRELMTTLARPEARVALYHAIRDGRYRFRPPRACLIPKEKRGEFRTVYVNAHEDRMILAIANRLFFDLTPDLVHPTCKSYRSCVGCGAVARELSRYVAKSADRGKVIGWKSDLSKYFDSVPLQYIDEAFDTLESRYGRSALVRTIREYYHSTEYTDTDGHTSHKYMSLRQGCAVSAWLANVLLYHIDCRLSSMDGCYMRYSDDMVFIGPEHAKAMECLRNELAGMGLSLNPRKVESIVCGRWFSFLGYSFCYSRVSLSPNRIHKFEASIRMAARGCRDSELLVRRLAYRLYKVNDWKCWATQVLPILTSEADVRTLWTYVVDSVRAADTGKRRIGGLGFCADRPEGCVTRGRGRNVSANRAKTPAAIDGLRSLACMRNALLHSKALYYALSNSP